MNLKSGMSIGLLALAFAAPASAAENRTATVGTDRTTFTWTGDPQTSIAGQFWWTGDPTADCNTFDFGAGPTPAMDYCDQTLVTVTDSGDLNVSLPDAGDGTTNDWDLYLYATDDGTPTDQLAASENTGGAESVDVPVDPGTYLVVAVPYQSVNGGYSGALAFTPADPA